MPQLKLVFKAFRSFSKKKKLVVMATSRLICFLCLFLSFSFFLPHFLFSFRQGFRCVFRLCGGCGAAAAGCPDRRGRIDAVLGQVARAQPGQNEAQGGAGRDGAQRWLCGLLAVPVLLYQHPPAAAALYTHL